MKINISEGGFMKTYYDSPKLEILALEQSDICTVSNFEDNGVNDIGWFVQ